MVQKLHILVIVVFANAGKVDITILMFCIKCSPCNRTRRRVKEIFLTIDKETLEKSAEGKEISVSTQEGVNIRLIEGYGDDDQYYVTLISHVDSGTLGLKVGEDETDITYELAEQGEVVAEYDKDGRSYQVRVFGTVDDPSMEVTEK